MRIKIFTYGWNIQKVVCAYCHKTIGYNIGCKNGGISHGICDKCFKKSKKGGQNK